MHYFGIFKDSQFPFRGFSHSRNIVRGLIQREDGRFIFTYIYHQDRFGLRDYLETPGGGVEAGESLETALQREIQEECGLTIHAIRPLGIVEDAYNLIQRHNINHYFYAKVTGEVEKKWTEGEQRMIKAMPWLTLEEAISRYKQLPNQGIAFLIKQRELQVLVFLQEQFMKLT
jgi:ADP-ribose pyrophosphatase YjhB (NUDIX family)